ncbi:MAG: DUF2059 domain-containing protein [Bauldia sp.]|nr:DUF2059 domain-containing protein [Bauldia sp.]
MTKLLRLVAIAAGLAVAALPARAQDDAATLAAAEDLFDLIGETMIDQLVALAVEQTWPVFESGLPPEIDAETSRLLRKELSAGLREYALQSLAAGPAIYARHFTEEDLRGLIAFYGTPLGMRLLETQAEISLAISELILTTVEAAAEDLIRRLGTILGERGYF